MKYQIEIKTNKIVGVFQDSQDVETWNYNKDIYIIKQSNIFFDIGDVFEETDEKLADSIRQQRDFTLVDKYFMTQFYRELTEGQKLELENYLTALRDAPQMLKLPVKPNWMV